jgi:hypothetical protein
MPSRQREVRDTETSRITESEARKVLKKKVECKRYVRSYPESEDLLVRFERRAFDYSYRTGVARMSFITMCNVDQNRK